MPSNQMTKRTLMTAVVLGLMTTLSVGTPVYAADTAKKKIALSNNYAGNSWRQAMLKSWERMPRMP